VSIELQSHDSEQVALPGAFFNFETLRKKGISLPPMFKPPVLLAFCGFSLRATDGWVGTWKLELSKDSKSHEADRRGTREWKNYVEHEYVVRQ